MFGFLMVCGVGIVAIVAATLIIEKIGARIGQYLADMCHLNPPPPH